VADPQTLTTHYCSPQNTKSLITCVYIVRSSQNFIALPGTLPNCALMHIVTLTYSATCWCLETSLCFHTSHMNLFQSLKTVAETAQNNNKSHNTAKLATTQRKYPQRKLPTTEVPRNVIDVAFSVRISLVRLTQSYRVYTELRHSH